MENQKFVNLDSDDTLFFSRQLQFIKAKSYDIKYAELKARQVLPVSFDAGPGAETIRYEQYQGVGVAKVIANYADDLPRADVKGKEFVGTIKSLGASYGYSLQEIRAAKFAGKPLEQRRANAAKRAIAQAENQIAFFGNSDYGLMGFLNNPNISTYSLPADGVQNGTVAGSPASTMWINKTPDQVIRDLNAMVNSVFNSTKGVEKPNTLLLPLTAFSYLSTTARSVYSDRTIMEYFLENTPFIETIDWLNELVGAGVGGTDAAVAYVKDADHLTLEIPQDFEQLNVQERGLEYLVPCHERIGGVINYYPLATVLISGL